MALTFHNAGMHVSFLAKGALSFNIKDPIDETMEDVRFGYSGPIPGVVRPKLEWKVKRLS